MKLPLWTKSFPEVVALAHRLLVLRMYFRAAEEYLRAAGLAPTDALETQMLLAAWMASERARGELSELETDGWL